MNEADRVRVFAAWFEKRGGWISGELLSLALDAVLVGYPPARAHELAMAFVFERPVRRVKS